MTGLAALLVRADGLWGSIGSSIMVAGLASLGFGVLRYFDDLDDVARRELDTKRFVELQRQIEAVTTMHRREGPLRPSRIVTRRPREHVRDAIHSLASDRSVEIDLIAISGKPFCEDFLDILLKRGRTHLRLLLMDPRGDMLARFSRDQGRDYEVLKREICDTTALILDLKDHAPVTSPIDGSSDLPFRTCGDEPSVVEVRWHEGFQNVTLLRVNDTCLVRTRLVNEASAPEVFFEIYRRFDEQEACFLTYRRYFETLWRASVVPVATMISPPDASRLPSARS